MKKVLIIFAMILMSFQIFAEAKEKTIYKYKKFEQFDFDELGVDGSSSSPGDISILSRFEKDRKNKLFEKPHFNVEMRRAMSRLQ